MQIKKSFYILFTLFLSKSTDARLSLEGKLRSTFDTDLYDSVLDHELCERQVSYMSQNNTLLLMTFLDAGARIPQGIFTGRTADYGNYFQCLGINQEVSDMKIEGKYCMINLPLQQNIELPFDIDMSDLQTRFELLNYAPISRDRLRSLERQNWLVLNLEGVRDMNNKIYICETVQDFMLRKSTYFSSISARSGPGSPLGYIAFNLGICIPKTCTSEEWVRNVLFNMSALGFEFQEHFCRLPNDKPMVAVDYVAIVVLSVLILLTALSTGYDLHHTHILKKDPSEVNNYYRMFSVYTNTKRLVTFTSNPNALECLDGIRSISMMWVIICHTFSVYINNMNLLDLMMWITSAKGVWISTGFFAVDTFFTLAGILLVYSSMGKMNGAQLIKKLHLFYLNRLLRMYPLLATIILLEATLFHKVGDGPYWVSVATNTERCRHFWWSTLLFIQNYLNPSDMCLSHTWYLAVDIQLFILSPLVLFWVLRGGRRYPLFALCSTILVVVTAATTFNAVMKLPSASLNAGDSENHLNYMYLYYLNTLTRAAPFLIGLLIGYILSILKGQRFIVNTGIAVLSWASALGIIALTFYTSYLTMSFDWDSRVGDVLFNSFMRAGWAVALGWIVIACVKGYGGPINWFLSLDVWKLLSRISYAMYLYHYPIQFIVNGMIVTPTYFSAGAKTFEFLAVFALSFIVSFVVTVVIDAPFSVLVKMMLRGGGKRNLKPQLKETEN